MKNSIQLLITLITCLFTALGFSQNGNSLLWEISGNGLKEPSYIYGTIHFICEDDYSINEKVKKAVANADVFVAEWNFGNVDNLKEFQNAYKSTIPLKERLSANEYEKFVDVFNQNSKFLFEPSKSGLAALDQVSESGIAIMFTMKLCQCQIVTIDDVGLLQEAITNSIKTDGLDTVEELLTVTKKT